MIVLGRGLLRSQLGHPPAAQIQQPPLPPAPHPVPPGPIIDHPTLANAPNTAQPHALLPRPLASVRCAPSKCGTLLVFLMAMSFTHCNPPWPLLAFCHPEFKWTTTRVWGNLTFPVGTLVIKGQTVTVACPPLYTIDWSDTTDLFGQNMSFSETFYKTGAYTKWPFVHPPKRCVTVLETNTLFPADCPAYQSCGGMTWTQIDSSWYGREVGMCIGPGDVGHVSITDQDIYYHGGALAADWGAIYKPKHFSEDYDVNHVLQHLTLIRFTNRDVLIMHDVYKNYITADRSGLTLNSIAHMSASGSTICPSMLPAAYYGQGIIYDGPTLVEWPPGVPMNVPRSDAYFAPTLPQLGKVYLQVNSSHIMTLERGGAWLYNTRREPVVCMSHTYVTAYAFPGHAWLKSALTAIINILVDVVLSLVGSFTGAVSDTLLVVNSTYRFYEMIFIAAVVLWRGGSVWKSAVAMAAYGIVIGFAR